MFAHNIIHVIRERRSVMLMQGVGVFLFLVIVDFCIKSFVKENFAYMCNEGVAFSIHIPSIIFIFSWLVVVCVLMYHWLRIYKNGIMAQLPYIFILSGAIGNVIDRNLYGCVIDYVPFFHISSYNFADLLITIGALMILIKSIKK